MSDDGACLCAMHTAAHGEHDAIASCLHAALARSLLDDPSHLENTRALTRGVCTWADNHGWLPVQEVRIGATRQTKRGPYRGRVDVVCTRAHGQAPIAIEIDRSNKRWSLQKLEHLATEGHIAIWVRWRGPVVSVPDSVHLVDIASGGRPDKFSGPTRE